MSQVGTEHPRRSVSCIIPCYNCAYTIERSVNSVINQHYPVLEIILVNDCSTDETASVLARLEAMDDRIRVFDLPSNSGPSHARNRGWDKARGDYIAFLDSDDSWHPQKIEFQMRILDLYSDLIILGHLVDVANEGDPYPYYKLSQSELLSHTQMITHHSVIMRNPWSTPTVLVRADVSSRFNEGMRAAEDYLLWVDLLLMEGEGARLNMPLSRLYKARYGVDGLSANLWQMERGELKAIRAMHSKGYIGNLSLILLYTFSLIKYTIRYINSSFRRN